MFNEKVSAAKSLMVLGKLLILICSTPVLADSINNPRFFEYNGSNFTNRLAEVTFGWFRTLDDDQMEQYQQSLVHAVLVADNGKAVSWYKRDASGTATPVMTWPNGDWYCRRVYVSVIAYSTQKNMTATACFNYAHSNWRWIEN